METDELPPAVFVAGLPRSGTTYLFTLLSQWVFFSIYPTMRCMQLNDINFKLHYRIYGDAGCALSCYQCLFYERSVVHMNCGSVNHFKELINEVRSAGAIFECVLF